jgi:hypothetical protein
MQNFSKILTFGVSHTQKNTQAEQQKNRPQFRIFSGRCGRCCFIGNSAQFHCKRGRFIAFGINLVANRPKTGRVRLRFAEILQNQALSDFLYACKLPAN